MRSRIWSRRRASLASSTSRRVVGLGSPVEVPAVRGSQREFGRTRPAQDPSGREPAVDRRWRVLEPRPSLSGAVRVGAISCQRTYVAWALNGSRALVRCSSPGPVNVMSLSGHRVPTSTTGSVAAAYPLAALSRYSARSTSPGSNYVRNTEAHIPTVPIDCVLRGAASTDRATPGMHINCRHCGHINAGCWTSCCIRPPRALCCPG